jgi:hypothetical protein
MMNDPRKTELFEDTSVLELKDNLAIDSALAVWDMASETAAHVLKGDIARIAFEQYF